MPPPLSEWRLRNRLALLFVAALAAGCGTTGTGIGHGSTTSTTPTAGTTATNTSTPRASETTTTRVSRATSTSVVATAGIVKGITAIGDSVMEDYAAALIRDLPGINVQASISRQWSAGIREVASLRAHKDLGSTVIIGLGTNGPITDGDFMAMMSALRGVSHVVFVTVFVDRPWQDQVNAVLRRGVARYPKTVLADWATLAAAHRNWLYSDGTHLPIGGPGAVALAALIARSVHSLS